MNGCRKRREFTQKIVSEILAWIDSDVSRHMTVAIIAARAGYSKWHFQKLFQACTGMSIAAYIRLRRIERAALLLTSSDSPAYEIHYVVGFDNRGTFFREFRRHFDTSPVKYRKQHRQQTAE